MTYLKLELVRNWFLKPSTGTSYPVIRDADVLNFRIPLFSDLAQSEVVHLTNACFEARGSSTELLLQAQKTLEIVVEKGEEAAFSYLDGIRGH